MPAKWNKAPARYRAGLRGYAEDRAATGGFLRAVLANDLFLAIGRASTTDLAALPTLVRFIRQNLPLESFGSPASVDAWIAGEDVEDQEEFSTRTVDYLRGDS